MGLIAFLVLMWAEVGLGAEALTGTGVPSVFRPGCVLIMLNVNATSAALNAVPSFHFTPGRMVKVIDLPPLLQAYLVASHG